jgi:Tfp pilus assembly protein PilX
MRRTTVADLTNERGVALPMAMVLLVILAGLTMAFTALATTEPVVARNHEFSARARALAESGLERAMWALSNPTATGGIPESMGATAPAPYDGNSYVEVSALGGFSVTVSAGSEAWERQVSAVGWAAEASTSSGTRRKIQAVLSKLRWTQVAAPCALCVKGDLDVGANANIDARSNHCAGSTPDGGTMSLGLTPVPVGTIYGPGNDTANEVGLPSPDYPASVSSSKFSFTLTADDLDMLKQTARRQNRYFTGTVSFDDVSPMPNGLVFVDTTTGASFGSGTPDGEEARVTISGAHPAWSGWLIVAGSIEITGSVAMTGTVYAQDDVLFTGSGDITGVVVSENRKYPLTTIAPSAGNANITYHCTSAQNGGGTISTNAYALKAGTYTEVEGR